MDLLGGLRKSHASKGGRQRFRIHFAAGTLKVVVLPRLHIRRLKNANTSDTKETRERQKKKKKKEEKKWRQQPTNDTASTHVHVQEGTQ